MQRRLKIKIVTNEHNNGLHCLFTLSALFGIKVETKMQMLDAPSPHPLRSIG
jgi:hypothetical protein